MALLALAGTSPGGNASATAVPQAVDRWPSPEVRSAVSRAPRSLLHLADGDVVLARQPIVWTGDQLLLPDAGAVPFGRVMTVEIQQRRTAERMRQGLWLGVLVGGLALLADGAGDEDSGAQAGRTLLYIAGGSMAGAAAGAIVGHRAFRSDAVYIRPLHVAGAAERQQGLVEHRVPGREPRIRTRLAVTPFAGVSGFSERAGGTAERPRAAPAYGLAASQELGLQAQLAITPRQVLRVGASVIRTQPQVRDGSGRGIMHDVNWLRRVELGMELRMRPGVPGYFVVAVDGLYHPEGYFGFSADPNLMPRLGAGLGYDVFLAGDRRLRMEWSYRVGRFDSAMARERGHPMPRLTRDTSFNMGGYLPLRR